MKLRGISVAALLAVTSALLTALPAEARMTPSTTVAESSSDAVGLIVKYKPAVNPIAPNGEPTGENFAGVDLENSTDLGGGFKSVDFATDLEPEEIQAAADRIALDPRVESVSLNQTFQAANYVAKPIAGSILPNNDPLDLPIVIRTAVRVAAAPATTATDAWRSPNQVAVRLAWSKPTTRVSGKIAGYKIQIYASSAWRTLYSRTASTTRSYTSTSPYLKAGIQSRFRVAAVNYYAGRYYTGSYRYIYATPTALPKPNTRIQIQNATNEMRFSWAPLTSPSDLGGLQVSYNLRVVDENNVTQTCSTSTSTTCVISPVTVGARYTATLTISNDRGSVTVGPVTATFSMATPVNTNDTYFNNQWHLKTGVSNPYGMNVTGAWDSETGSPDVYVAVLDTGITDHPDLESNVVAGYDMVSGVSMPRDSTHSSPWTSFVSANDGDGPDNDPRDPGDHHYEDGTFIKSSWHGTHVAGIIAAVDNSVGVLGVAPNVKIIPVRVLGADGGSEADIVAGLNWAAGEAVGSAPLNAHPANVINMSIGGQGTCFDSSPTATVLRRLKDDGITVVTAAGNDSSLASFSYPGNCYPTINVGAVGKTGKPTFYSNYGPGVDVAAPGGDYCYAIGSTQASGQIYSTLNSGTTSPGNATYAYELGTSMASPNVAGVVALMYSALLRKNPTVTRDAALVTSMWTAISNTVTPLASTVPPAEPSGRFCVSTNKTSQSYGAGIVNAKAAVDAILQ